MRRVVADAESIARRHGGSGYADNALWQAATIALASYRVYRRPVDRTDGLELLATLIKRYPSSSLVDEARALLRKHGPSPSRTKSAGTVASRERTASPSERMTSPPVGAAVTAPVSTPAVIPASHASASSAPAASASALPVAPVRALEIAPPVRAADNAAPGHALESASPTVRSSAATGRIATLRGVRRTQIGDTIRLTLDFDGEVAFDQQRLPGPDRVFFDFARTAPIAALADTVLQYDGAAVRRVRLGRPRPDVTRLAIDLDGVAAFTVFALYHPFRLTIDLQPAAPGRPATPMQPATTVAATMRPEPAAAPTLSRHTAAPALPPVPRTGLVPTAAAVAMPTTVPPPAPPPLPLLRANRLTAPSAVRPMPAPTRLVVTQPLLAVDDTPLSPGRLRASVTAAPAVATRAVTRPPSLLRMRRTQPLMVRAAIRPPRGLTAGIQLAAYLVPTVRVPLAERQPATAPAAPLPLMPAAPAEIGSGGFSIARQLGLGVSRIVIDPGHGGKDPGASGAKTTEAEVVLDVALRVEKVLAAEAGIEVVLTRRTDTFIPLEERTAIANRQGADLFLSIHANSSRNRKAAGVETYVLNFASNAEAAAVAARENASAAGSMRNLPDMVRAITQGSKRDESRELAGAVQESMVTRLRPHNQGLRDLGVKQAPFVVLIGAGMPSVLAEIAFISHDAEGGLLRTEKYRQRIADALAAAILRYTRTLKPVGTVASQN
jgi:N-acetylmuramoyl-L-alanine amidase